jgi:hypothetical protein
MMKAVLKD